MFPTHYSRARQELFAFQVHRIADKFADQDVSLICLGEDCLLSSDAQGTRFEIAVLHTRGYRRLAVIQFEVLEAHGEHPEQALQALKSAAAALGLTAIRSATAIATNDYTHDGATDGMYFAQRTLH